jgi:hypothetical protein
MSGSFLEGSRAELGLLQTLSRSLLIQLHGLFYKEEKNSHDMTFCAAREIFDIAKRLKGDDERYWGLPMNASPFRCHVHQ